MLSRSGLAVLALICCTDLVSAAGAANLSPQDIKATFATGTAFTATSPAGTAYLMVLKPDGTASRTPKKGTPAVMGTWRLSADGYCSTWGKNPESCYTIQQSGTKYTVLDKKGQVAAHWNK
jgi:hypothetical protein